MKIVRIAAALLLTLVLTACFYGPGAFTSTLDLRRDGTFAFTYKGEIIFLSPPDMMGKMNSAPGVWKDDMASCSGEGENSATRPCTAAEIAKQRKDWEAERAAAAAKKQQEAAEFGAMFGYTPGDDAANRKLAANMMRYDGWKSVVYKGNGIFDVDYQQSGRLDHDFIFPLLPTQNNLVLPFVTIRGQAGNMARMTAPAFVNNPGQSMMAGMAAMKGNGAGGDDMGLHKASGSFTLTTDGDIRTNNTENGPADISGGRKLVWQVDADSKAVPEALINLN
ncbi:MAG: hypothetical protein ABI395_03380 [Sphingobium sp.]